MEKLHTGTASESFSPGLTSDMVTQTSTVEGEAHLADSRVHDDFAIFLSGADGAPDESVAIEGLVRKAED